MRVGTKSILIFFLILEVTMSKRSSMSIPKMQMPKPQAVKVQPVKTQPIKVQPVHAVKITPNISKPNQGVVGGKSLIPLNLRQFPIEQLQGHSLRELQEISKNRAKPPVNRIIKPPFVMPKKGNT